MRIRVDSSSVAQTTWREYAARFILGGVITAATGLVAEKFGAGVGGLFLAFPAIFPASATLIEKHAKKKKQAAGMDGTNRGRSEAGLDAAGAAMGAIGLFVFGLIVWQFAPEHKPWLVLIAATFAWFAASVLIWELRRLV